MILKGNCLDTLKTLPDYSVDSIVTDPPYELGFLGKSWDNSGIAFSTELWAECLRVLKPGGHLLAFSGSRTYHRMVCAIEDAGFEIRDQIMWIYSSGFPKSFDVSKAIDKGIGENRKRQLRFTEWMRSTGITAKQIDEATKTHMGYHYITRSTQPLIATANLFDKLRHLLPEVPEEIERLVAERTGIEWTAYKNREVVGTKKFCLIFDASKSIEVDITAPATPEAQQWQGWGTVLKPAHEPIVVARKPLIGTVANNVLTYGTGAINIDGSRVGTEIRHNPSNSNDGTTAARWTQGRETQGRWPANVIHDGSDEVLAGFPNEAGRYFYCAKASTSERNAGLEGIANIHPTVKPLALMRYLIKLVTPPGGTVLDPFLGSGSTAVAAILEGFEWVGCEMTEEYFPIIEARVEWAENQPKTLI
jgi:site-specific DNA-methyltransferase (adenine-specific)